MKNEDPTLKYTEACRNYARGMPFLGINDKESAKKGIVLFGKLCE